MNQFYVINYDTVSSCDLFFVNSFPEQTNKQTNVLLSLTSNTKSILSSTNNIIISSNIYNKRRQKQPKKNYNNICKQKTKKITIISSNIYNKT